ENCISMMSTHAPRRLAASGSVFRLISRPFLNSPRVRTLRNSPDESAEARNAVTLLLGRFLRVSETTLVSSRYPAAADILSDLDVAAGIAITHDQKLVELRSPEQVCLEVRLMFRQRSIIFN